MIFSAKKNKSQPGLERIAQDMRDTEIKANLASL